MLTNMIESSILKSTDHTSQVKPANLSDRFILEGEPHIDNFSESESEVFKSDFEDDWESCVSSVEEDENVSMMQLALKIPRMHLITLFPPGH